MSLSLPLEGSNTRCHYTGLLWFEIWGSNPGPAACKAITPPRPRQASSPAPKLITKHMTLTHIHLLSVFIAAFVIHVYAN